MNAKRHVKELEESLLRMQKSAANALAHLYKTNPKAVPAPLRIAAVEVVSASTKLNETRERYVREGRL
jgi:hypothetical protein